MKKINAYFGEVYNELVHKVTWPAFGQLQSSAVVVMIASVIMSLVIFAMDLTFRQVMTFIYEFLY
jgi:preprotein translocase subunit SecE